MSNNLRGALFALTGFAIFAVHDVLVRIMGGNFSPVQTLFFTSLLSFPVLTLLLVQDDTRGNLRPVHPIWISVRSLIVVLASMCGFYAFANLPLAQVYAILFTVPLLVTVLAIPVLGEKVGIHRALAILIGLAGVIVVVQPGTTPLSIAHLAAFGAAVGGASQSVISRRIGNEERPVVMMLYPLMALFIAMGLGLSQVYQPMQLFDLAGMAGIAFLGFIASFCLVWAYRAGEAAIVAPMQYSQIIWAVIFGTVLFNESLDRPTLIGAGLVILSGLYILLRETRSGKSENQPVTRTRSRSISPGGFRVSAILRRNRSKD